MSLAEFQTTGPDLDPHLGQQAAMGEAGLTLNAQRVLGHEPTGQSSQKDRKRIGAALARLRMERRAEKSNVADQLYEPDGNIPERELSDEKRRENQASRERQFRDRMDRYPQSLHDSQITSEKVLDALARRRQDGTRKSSYRKVEDPEKLQTRILRGDKHVYTLHSGPSAFRRYRPVPDAIGNTHVGGLRDHEDRDLFTKRGAKGKLYVADDYGVPTRRDAYAVKSGRQLDRFAQQGYLTGRHQGVRGLRSTDATEGERAMLGIGGDRKTLTDSELLYLHQEYGSSDRQRGVSATSTSKPLLSNAGDGFANVPYSLPAEAKGKKAGEFLAPDGKARKLKIDLARIPPRGEDEPPQLVNLHHRIPGLKPAIQLPTEYNTSMEDGVIKQGDIKYDPERAAKHFNWSVRKNREIYIQTLTSPMEADRATVHDRERFLGPPTRNVQHAAREKVYKEREAARQKAEAKRIRDEENKRRGEERRSQMAKNGGGTPDRGGPKE